MKRAAKPLGLIGASKEHDHSLTDGYTFAIPKPHSEGNAVILDKIVELTKLKPPHSVTDLEPILHFKTKFYKRIGNYDNTVGEPTTVWKRIQFVQQKNYADSNLLRLEPDELYACIFRQEI